MLAIAPSTTYSNQADDSITRTEQKQSPKQENLSSADKQVQEDIIELHVRPTLELFKKFDFILENLAQVINNNQLKGCDKAKALDHLKLLRFNIFQIQKSSALINDQMSIKLLNVLFKGLADHIRTLIQNRFSKLEEPNFENLVKDTITRGAPSFDALRKDISDNEQLIKTIESEANRIGLSVFNRAYRRVEKFMDDYQVLPRTGKLLIGALIGYVLISRIPGQYVPDTEDVQKFGEQKVLELIKQSEDSWLTKLQNFTFGQNVRVNDLTKKITNSSFVKTPGWIEYYLKNIGIADLTFPALITWKLFENQISDTFRDSRVWAEKKWEIFRSYLRGGPIVRKVEKWDKEPTVRFKDVIGREHAKDILWRVVEYIRDHERFDRAGIIPAAGYLLAGPSRTGKTYIAEALAGEIKDALEAQGITDKFNYIYFTAAEVLQWGIAPIMAYAKHHAPCVLFIDEIDMLGAQRDRNAQTLSELLTAMSGAMMNADNSRQVIMLAATNAPQNLDYALLQPGRFEKTIWFTYPTLAERAHFLDRELEKRAILTINSNYLYKLAQETEGMSFEGLRAIIVTALQYARSEGEVLNEMHLERAFDEESRLIIFEDPRISEQERKLIALHQAGHAIATMLLNGNQSVAKVTICPVNVKPKEEPVWMKYVDEKEKQESVEYGKLFLVKKPDAGAFSGHDDLIAQCKIDLAGHVAEKLLLGNTGYTYHRHDNQKALAMAKYITFRGMKESELPKEQCKKLQQDAYQLMQQCEAEVSELLSKHKDKIQTTAQALEKYLSLNGFHLELIMEGKPLIEEEPTKKEETAAQPTAAT
jgi:cell division protease FtsH